MLVKCSAVGLVGLCRFAFALLALTDVDWPLQVGCLFRAHTPYSRRHFVTSETNLGRQKLGEPCIKKPLSYDGASRRPSAPFKAGGVAAAQRDRSRLRVGGGGGRRRQRALRDARPQPASGDGRLRATAGLGGERRGGGREGADAAHRPRDAGPEPGPAAGFADLGPRPAIYVCGDGAGAAAPRARALASSEARDAERRRLADDCR